MNNENQLAKILIVDDEQDMLAMTQKKLSSMGYATITATNGAECLAIAEREQPDVVLLDIVLPDSDGFTLCQNIRDRRWPMTVIIYTARIEAADARQALAVGADDLTLKMDNLSGIVSAIEDQLRKRKNHEQSFPQP